MESDDDDQLAGQENTVKLTKHSRKNSKRKNVYVVPLFEH